MTNIQPEQAKQQTLFSEEQPEQSEQQTQSVEQKELKKMKCVISPYYDFCMRWHRVASTSLILEIVSDDGVYAKLECEELGVRIAFDAPAPKEPGYDYVIEARDNGTLKDKYNAAEFFTWYGLKKRKEQGILLIFGKAGDVLDQYVFCDTSCYLQGNYLNPLWLKTA